MTTTKTNSAPALDALRCIKADPAAALANHATGAGAVLHKSLSLRCAAHWLAGHGKQEATRDNAARKALGETPVTGDLLRLAVKLGADHATAAGANADKWSATDNAAKTYRNKVCNAAVAALALLTYASETVAADLLTGNQNQLATLGAILVGTAKGDAAALATWAELDQTARDVVAAAAAKADEGKAKRAARQPAGEAGEAGEAGDVGTPTGADADLSAIADAVALAIARVQELTASGKMQAAVRAKLALVVSDLTSAGALTGADMGALTAKAVRRLTA